MKDFVIKPDWYLEQLINEFTWHNLSSVLKNVTPQQEATTTIFHCGCGVLFVTCITWWANLCMLSHSCLDVLFGRQKTRVCFVINVPRSNTCRRLSCQGEPGHVVVIFLLDHLITCNSLWYSSLNQFLDCPNCPILFELVVSAFNWDAHKISYWFLTLSWLISLVQWTPLDLSAKYGHS